jgi:hypothetical protein
MTCDVLNCIADAWFRLGFLSAADQATAGNWVTIAELYQFGDDAAKLLARESSVFLSYDNSINVVAGTPQYSLPASHVFTVTAWLVYAGLPLQQLRPTTVGQLFALDANWSTSVGDSVRISLDASSVGICVLYPIPVANSTLDQVLQEYPATVALAESVLAVSPVLQDYFTDALIQGARGKESDSAMPEVAAHMAQRRALYEQVIQHLWGPGQ